MITPSLIKSVSNFIKYKQARETVIMVITNGITDSNKGFPAVFSGYMKNETKKGTNHTTNPKITILKYLFIC
jgi:hypothetical protein